MIHVAIIEDDNDLKDFLIDLINGSGKAVCNYAFCDAETAIATIPSLDLDVILVDIGLPDRNGIECISLLKSKNVASQFLIYTSFADTELIFEALKAGASGYIVKTMDSSKIIDAIMDIQN